VRPPGSASIPRGASGLLPPRHSLGLKLYFYERLRRSSPRHVLGRSHRHEPAGYVVIPQAIPGHDATRDAFCEWKAAWRISDELALRLSKMQDGFQGRNLGTPGAPRPTGTPPALLIISGFRSREEQDALEAAGRPTAPFDLSTHTTCPATGADLRIGDLPGSQVPEELKRWFGSLAAVSGLRWGGGSSRTNGIPSDWNHVDLGPRNP